MTLDAKIEAVLYFKGEPISRKELSSMLGKDIAEIDEALNTLDSKLAGRGLTLVKKDETVMLGTSPEISPLIEKLVREELDRDLGKAGIETL